MMVYGGTCQKPWGWDLPNSSSTVGFNRGVWNQGEGVISIFHYVTVGKYLLVSCVHIDPYTPLYKSLYTNPVPKKSSNSKPKKTFIRGYRHFFWNTSPHDWRKNQESFIFFSRRNCWHRCQPAHIKPMFPRDFPVIFLFKANIDP